MVKVGAKSIDADAGRDEEDRVHDGGLSKPPALCRVPLPRFPSRATAPGTIEMNSYVHGGSSKASFYQAEPKSWKGERSERRAQDEGVLRPKAGQA